MAQSSGDQAHSSDMAQQLEKLMGYGSDITIQFDDGELPANGFLLALHSSVLKGAVEAAGPGSSESSSGSDSSSQKRKRNSSLPMAGTKTDEWLQLAPFLYPLVPPATISDWAQLEVLLEVATKYDIALVLHKADVYLSENAWQLEADPKSEKSVWKWLRLADESGLQQCMTALAQRAAEVDRSGCADVANLQGLAPHALQQLVVACAGKGHGEECVRRCPACRCSLKHRMAWACTNCRHAYSV